MKPTSDFNRAELDLFTADVGVIYGRMFASKYPDPLGFGKTPSRFSDPGLLGPDRRFGVLYLGEALDVCFLEAFLRDKRNGTVGDLPIEEAELRALSFAEIAISEPLKLIDLRADGLTRMGIPTDVARSSDQALAQEWSLAINQHPESVDGIIYRSRLNEKTNIAVYDLRVESNRPLIKATGLASLLSQYRVALLR